MKKIIGESSTLAEALSHVSLLAGLNRPVLISGERGSGKELIAERLHYLSQRWDRSFHKINCAAISESLLDSELFGHEAGAFTGASKQHQGLFERADGGTLFLDELATLPLRIQEKLLRVIEYGEFERLGGQKTLHVDIRVIAATHANLPKMATEGEFRHDLLDRLAFDVVLVPPLRERKEDIPALADHFATRMALELGWDYYSGFTQQAMDTLYFHPWPGNIRELRNVVERSLCRWQDKESAIDEVVINPFFNEHMSSTDTSHDATPPSLHPADERATGEAAPSKTKAVTENQLDFKAAVGNFETALLRETLQRHQFHQRESAKALGLSYHQLRGLLKKYPSVLGDKP